MAHQSESARFKTFFELALQVYKEKAAQHPLAIKLQSCDTIEAITDFMQDQAQVFRYFQGSDQIMESIKMIVSNCIR